MSGFGSVFLLDATEREKVDGLIVVNEAHLVVRPPRNSAVGLDFVNMNEKT